MPTYRFFFEGSWDAHPQSGGLLASGAISDRAPIRENVTLSQKTEGDYQLTTDSAVPVAFGNLEEANVVIVFCDQPISVILTSPGGTAQVVDIDDMLTIISRTNAYTAVSLQRTPATLTNCTVFLGQQA